MILSIIAILYALSSFNILIPLIVANYRDVDKGYDFIIVGAGSSGAVMANRLSEKPHNYKVLLIEAGGKEYLLSQIPFTTTVNLLTHQNWRFKSEPQENACLGFKESRAIMSAGKVLGGTSSINIMMYMRGNHRDYDRWASLGNYGWSWKEVFPYFLKSENYKSNTTNDDYHGKKGLLAVTTLPYQTKLVNPFQEAVQSMGYSRRDVNGEFQSGVMPIQVTILKGRRFSTNRAFIKTASKRSNLHIMTHTRVLKVLFDKDKRAIGVAYVRKGKEYHVKASKEVILSAGIMNTPKILMLSGIGPKEHLSEFNINAIVNLPGVGQNLHDHIANTGIVFTIKTNDAISLTKAIRPDNLLRYVLFGSGPLTVPTGCESAALMKTRFANQSDDWPDVQIHFASFTPLTDSGRISRPAIGYSDNTWNKYFKPSLGKNSFMVLPFTLNTKSRGFVKLRSKNPYDDPIIDPKIFSHPDDLKAMVEALKISVALGNHTVFKKFGAELIPSVCPGCENHIYLSEDYWTCFALHFSCTGYHLAGTAKMGINTDPMAVVDPELRVYGVEGLRVVDCSIMPIAPTSNTNAPAIMVAEKAADMIKNTYK